MERKPTRPEEAAKILADPAMRCLGNKELQRLTGLGHWNFWCARKKNPEYALEKKTKPKKPKAMTPTLAFPVDESAPTPEPVTPVTVADDVAKSDVFIPATKDEIEEFNFRTSRLPKLEREELIARTAHADLRINGIKTGGMTRTAEKYKTRQHKLKEWFLKYGLSKSSRPITLEPKHEPKTLTPAPVADVQPQPSDKAGKIAAIMAEIGKLQQMIAELI